MGLSIYHFKPLSTSFYTPPSNDVKIMEQLKHQEPVFFILNEEEDNPFFNWIKNLESKTQTKYIQERVDYQKSKPAYLKQLFLSFLQETKLNNPFNDYQMNLVFGFDHLNCTPDNIDGFEFTPIIYEYTYSSDTDIFVSFFTLSDNIQTVSNMFKTDSNCMIDMKKSPYFSVLYEFAFNQELISLMKDFFDKVKQIHLNNLKNQLIQFGLDNHQQQHYCEFAEVQLDIIEHQFNDQDEFVFSLIFIDIEEEDNDNDCDKYFSLPKVPNVPIYQNVVYLFELGYQGKGFTENSQYYQKYSNIDYEFIFDNNTLKQVAKEFKKDTPIQHWILKADEFVSFN